MGSSASICLRAAGFVLLVLVLRSGALAQYVGVELYPLQPPAGLTFPQNRAATIASQVGGYATSTPSHHQAALWGSNGAVLNLNPTNLTGYSDSLISGMGGGQQVGTASGTATGATSSNSHNHAMLWNGTADSAVDLHPAGIANLDYSQAFGTDGIHQVGGYGISPSGIQHALLWSGTAGSVVHLQPTKFANYGQSFAYGVSGNQQVGLIAAPSYMEVTNPNHAVLWTGTAASAVDLHPKNLPRNYNDGSVAVGIGGGQQVGWASYTLANPFSHAMLWTGTQESAVDLHPTGFNSSFAQATNGSVQVGYATKLVQGYPVESAFMWSGTAASAVNLDALLPAGLRISQAYAVNEAGDIFGVAADNTGLDHAVRWLAPPHTGSGSVAAGSNKNATVAGRDSTSGDVKVTFPSNTGGTFQNINRLTTLSQLAKDTSQPNFALPTASGLAQAWDLSFTGTFTGLATLTFHYDPSILAPGFDPSGLEIRHFTNGEWVALPGSVDAAANTITITTDSFSPFVLAPEPSAMALLSVIAAGAMTRRRRAMRHR